MTRTRRIPGRLRGFAVASLALAFLLGSSVVATAPAAAASAPITVELQESVDASHKISAKQVQLVTQAGAIVETGSTDLDGRYVFTSADDAETYSIRVQPGSPYQSVGTAFGRLDEVAVTGTTMVIDMVPLPGTLSGTIANWDPSLMDGLSVGNGTSMTLMRWYDPLGIDPLGWYPVDFDAHYLYHDWFTIAGVSDTEPYAVLFIPLTDSDFYPTSSEGHPVSAAGMLVEVGVAGDPAGNVSVGPVTLVAAGYLEGFVLSSGAVVPDGIVVAASLPTAPHEQYLIEPAWTDGTGAWTIKVPAGRDFLLLAADDNGDYYPLYWDDDLCGCAEDTVTVAVGATMGGLNFDLPPVATSVLFDLYLSEVDQANPPSELDLAGVTLHLYRPVPGGWLEVDSRDSNVAGLSHLVGSTAGSYRIRFSEGSDWLPFTRYTDDAGDDFSVAASCYLDVTGTALGDYLEYDFLIDAVATSPACGPEPAPSSSGAGGSGITTTPGSGTSRSRTSAVIEVPDPSVTPTPTPTPSATPTAEPSSEAPPAQAPDDDTSVGVDLTWLWWLLALLVLLGVIGGGVAVLRRR